ncbi:hypothetical protein ACIPM2_31945 [Streptomyces sp. NPDC086081]|uniref:hypothetical protein n=1 Tax=Streptomyces sp. NPDC086081 TaxID=3365749 RepID=UPI0038137FF2
MRVSTSVVAAVVSIVALSAAAPIPARQASAGTTKTAAARSAKLACNGATEPGKPIRVSPAINAKLKYTTVSGSVPLNHCTSPDGSHRHLRSARLDFRLTGQASCTRVRDVRSVGVITWYGKKNHGGTPIGRSHLQTPAHAARFSPGQALPALKITSGPLAGSTVKAGALGNAAHLNCGSRGISSLAGAFWAYAR